MARYQLLPNEAVLLSEEGAFRGARSFCDLLLTNLNLVVTNRSTFGKPKLDDVFPLRQIKIHNGQAQAILVSKRNVSVLAVYFVHGEETFRFGVGDARKAGAWAAKINEAITGQPAVEQAPQATGVLGAIGSTVGALKDTLGIFKSTPAPPPPVRVAGKCGSCGAPIAGIRGQATKCEYCDSVQQV